MVRTLLAHHPLLVLQLTTDSSIFLAFSRLDRHVFGKTDLESLSRSENP